MSATFLNISEISQFFLMSGIQIRSECSNILLDIMQQYKTVNERKAYLQVF